MAQTGRKAPAPSKLSAHTRSAARDSGLLFYNNSAEKGITMFYGNNGGCLWLIIILIILFGCNGCGNSCGNNCCCNSCNNSCNCGCDNNSCGCGC
jgi:hypothetical protein